MHREMLFAVVVFALCSLGAAEESFKAREAREAKLHEEHAEGATRQPACMEHLSQSREAEHPTR